MAMHGSGSDEQVTGRPSPRRWRVLLLVGLGAGLWASPSITGVSGAAHVGADAQARICSELAGAQARFGDHQSVDQALAARMQRYGCAGSQPSSTVTTLPGTTTTTFHLDCPLPGGGVGPCPTTTVLGTTTTSIHFDCPLPGGGVGPCPISTSTTIFPVTTVP